MPLRISPNKDLTAGAQITVSMSAPTSHRQVTFRVSGSDGRFFYTCPSFTTTLTSGTLVSSIKLPTTTPKLNYFDLTSTLAGSLQTQRALFRNRITRPNSREGTAYAAALCSQIRNGIMGTAARHRTSAASRRGIRVRSLKAS
jgi:hypothetical protein